VSFRSPPFVKGDVTRHRKISRPFTKDNFPGRALPDDIDFGYDLRIAST
jgi:hypothetical protein